ncbi:MAG: hypothetical protein WCK47_05440 [bacterium]|nr:hypothetical protein [Candidatus Sumerlaeota bacterium]
MAKKRRKPEGAEQRAEAAQRPDVRQPDTPADEIPSRRFSFREYLLLNVIFDVFCLVQLVLVAVILRESRGLYFFFGLLMVGFALVSVFDGLYDRGKFGNGESA